MNSSIAPTLYCLAHYIGDFHVRASAATGALAGNDNAILLVRLFHRETDDKPKYPRRDGYLLNRVAGVFLSKVYSEPKRRPCTMVRQAHGGRLDHAR